MRIPKNPLDPRFLKNQKKFYKALDRILIEQPGISHQSSEVYTRAKLGHSTFFDHFKNLDHAHRTEIRLMKANFKSELTKLDKHSDPKLVFRLIVVFIMKNRGFFQAATAMHDSSFFATMLSLTRPYLSRSWRHYGRALDKRIYRLYTANLLIIFEDWATLDFAATSSTSIISRLTHSADLFSAHLSDFVALAECQTPPTPPSPPTIKKEPK